MKLKNIKIGNQLLIGLTIISLMLLLLGLLSFHKTKKIQEQTQMMYEHPLQVRRAVSELINNINLIRLSTRDLMLAKNDGEILKATKFSELHSEEAKEQFQIIQNAYLGSHKDVDEAYDAFLKWLTERTLNTDLALKGNIEEVKQNIKDDGKIGRLRIDMLKKIDIIDHFAQNKSNTLYHNSIEFENQLLTQMIVLLTFTFILTFIVYIVFTRNIRIPLKHLTSKTNDFTNGNLYSRSEYQSTNEIGILSSAYNHLAHTIQTNIMINEKSNQFADTMVHENDMNLFFQNTLSLLLEFTNSQMAAVYILNENKTHFNHLQSIGLTEKAHRTFSVQEFEGEFGAVLINPKIKFISNLLSTKSIEFATVLGTFNPNEIVTIPMIINHEVKVIVTLATIYSYDDFSKVLLNKIHIPFNSRIEGVLGYSKLMIFSNVLENQNKELEIQKIELASQSKELTEQNRELETQKKELDEANKLKTIFLSNMSHELRTPLNSVIALSGVLNRKLKTQISEEDYSYIEVIQRNGKNLLSLINDILDISKIESGKENIEITNFDIYDSITEVVDLFQSQINEKKIQLILPERTEMNPISSDFKKVNQILQNLIGNAIKFTDQGFVKINIFKSLDYFKISIIDTGIGIKSEDLDHIFDEFRQADVTISRKYGGTGLGLAIVKKYVKLLGGNVKVESELGKGSTFEFELPFHISSNINVVEFSNNNQIIEKEITSNSLQNYNILIVDDSTPVIIQIKDFLEESNCSVKIAKNGKEALQNIKSQIPDGIILDLMMPEIDGFELLEMIRNDDTTTNIPVLILTAKNITKDEMNFLKRNNVFQCIQKGDICKKDFLNAVMRMINVQDHIIKEKTNLM
jgi:signal transduction histidine kinase/CheY-like chemotaxis protein